MTTAYLFLSLFACMAIGLSVSLSLKVSSLSTLLFFILAGAFMTTSEGPRGE